MAIVVCSFRNGMGICAKTKSEPPIFAWIGFKSAAGNWQGPENILMGNASLENLSQNFEKILQSVILESHGSLAGMLQVLHFHTTY